MEGMQPPLSAPGVPRVKPGGAQELLSSQNICHPDARIAIGKVLFTGNTLVEVLRGYGLSHTTR